MCIISHSVNNVANTKLFVGLNQEKTKQITIYSNTVDSITNNNAMILPVPYPNSVQFIDLSKYKDIFNDCDSCFVRKIPRSYNSATLSFSRSSLPVFEVGSYKVSLAYNLNDLKRVDNSVFELSPGCEKLLSEDYNENYWGFIICKLKQGNENYHPFAYSHAILNGYVFIPTKHYHDSNISNNISSNSWYNNYFPLKFNNNVDDWDHEIYLYNIKNYISNWCNNFKMKEEKWIGDNNLNLSKIKFELPELEVFTKLIIKNSNPNRDIVFPISY